MASINAPAFADIRDDLETLLQERLEDAGGVQATAVSESDFIPGYGALLGLGRNPMTLLDDRP